MMLDRFLDGFIRGRDTLESRLMNERNWHTVNKHIKSKDLVFFSLPISLFLDLTVRTMHLKGNQRMFTLGGLSDKPAHAIYFECKDGGTVSVAKYFEMTYGLRLQNAGLPCAI